MKLVFFALGMAVGSLFFSKKAKPDMPKGFAEGGYVPRPAHGEAQFFIVDDRQSLSDYLFSPDGTKAFVKYFNRNRPNL